MNLCAYKTRSTGFKQGPELRILIADDDATSRLVLEAMGSKLGHQCVVAQDGSRAWELLSSEGIDVLLTDWQMPGVDGPELCRRVRNELSGSYIYIVLITGLGNPEQVLEGMGAGADDYLVKPVDAFAVQTRLVAAERVTNLHRQVAHFREKLEQANFELLDRSLTDPLTGLGNRRRMEEDLARTHAQALRMERAYGMVLFDIDHFKLYNDHYGHLAGDEALRQIARCLGRVVRAGESSYRYGGEEFLVLLPDCNAEEAAIAARRICGEVANTAIPHDARPTAPPFVTLSGGVSCWKPGSVFSVTELLNQADKALFSAKSAGRNRIHVAPVHYEGEGKLRPIDFPAIPDASNLVHKGM
jgi:diguanylate cyclase (GGDEF)-like protein